MTSVLIPGGTLEPGDDSFSLYFVNAREQFDASVPGVLARTIDVASATTVGFTVAAPIPEPSTWATLGAGIALLAFGGRARRR